jgi:NAD(P)-dependent dehydrogenase (short-subunit alcohol dehydrogenase family)
MKAETDNHLAVVTGTSQGIGAALAAALLDNGWMGTGLSRRPADLDHPHYRHLTADLGEARALDDLIATEISPLLGQRDWQRVALVNNAAGMGELTTVDRLTTRGLDNLMTVNVVAPVRLMGAVLQDAPSAASLRIVNISSGAAHRAIPGLADYCASKAALRAAGQAAAAELVRNHRDAAILSYEPGVVETGMQRAARAADPERFPSHDDFLGFQARGLLAEPHQVTGPVLDFVAGTPAETFTEARYDPEA